MASLGLAQIDEHTSLVQPNCNSSLVLPRLLSRGTPQADMCGEKTPECWPRRLYGGDAAPEIWMGAPTPQNAGCGFACGEQTPEVWPDYAPSFHVDCQPSAVAAAASTDAATAPNLVGEAPAMMPIWPAQMAFPMGMAFGGSDLNVAGYTMQQMARPEPAVQPAAGPSPVHPVQKSRLEMRASKTTATPPAKQRSSGVSANSLPAEDACPVAVYVDLSVLRERKHKR